ncbi:hypothetical protein BXY41_103104 [Lacrimispora xylanisolvens]|uniref:Uncharacterized protein n=1 Tax=Lacrimispora xylanisolvens TaxID=384636 RepID=A0A2S6HVJ2_9FIRM|nr:hypothetical protein BXY41_103104 [Hungatella xylanolytica]
MIWQQLTVDADAIATTEDVVITTVVVLSGLLSFFCSAVAAITAAVADAATVVAVAEMMVVAVGFGSSFFCSAAAATDLVAVTSAAKQNIKQDPNHLWFGSCFRLTAALTFFLSRPCKSRLVTCSFLVVSVLLLFHAFIINFVNRISIYD